MKVASEQRGRRSETRGRDQQGLSLVELLIGLAVGLFLVAGIIQLLVSSRVSYTAEENFSRLQENGRYAANAVARDARMARNMGCRSLMLEEVQETLNVVACGLLANPGDCTGDSIVRSDLPIGYDADFSGGEPTQQGDWGALPGAVAGHWVRGDVLALWGVTGGGAFVSNALTVARTEDIVLEAPSAVLDEGDMALVTDCVGSDLFRASGVAKNADGKVTQLQHGVGDDMNASAALSRAYNFVGDPLAPGTPIKAMVFPFDFRVYFICCTDTNTGGLEDNAANCRAASERYRPSLCRWSARNGTQQLVGEVADMRVTYGGDTNDDGTLDFFPGDATTIRTAKRVTDDGSWPNVVSAQVELLLASAAAVRTQGQVPARGTWPPNDPTDPPAPEAVAADTLGAGLASDRRRYERFAFTVALRAKAPWYVKQP